MLRIAATSLVLVATATLAAGCGGSGHSAAEAHLAALANAVCREAENLGPHGRLKAELAKLRAQLNSDQKLPRVATYVADVQASDRLQAALSKLSYKEYQPAASTLLKESSRLERKIQAHLKALGWTCMGTGL
ncbi:MAG: hypothetical protein ABSG95_04500 [Solirubrobacteraceae bacterium]